MIRVALIEDDHEIREHLALIINSSEEFECSQTFHKVEEAWQELLRDPPDVLLLDITLTGGMTGLEGIKFLRSKGGDSLRSSCLRCIRKMGWSSRPFAPAPAVT